MHFADRSRPSHRSSFEESLYRHVTTTFWCNSAAALARGTGLGKSTCSAVGADGSASGTVTLEIELLAVLSAREWTVRDSAVRARALPHRCGDDVAADNVEWVFSGAPSPSKNP